MKAYKAFSNIFYKILYGIMTVLLGIGILGTLYKIVDVARNAGYPLLPVAICVIAGFALLVMLCFFVFRRIDNMSDRTDRLFMPVGFVVMAIGFIFLLLIYYRSVQSTDSFICLDVAKFIADGGVVDNSTPFSSFMAMYPNNYCFVLACSLVLKVFAFLPERGIWVMMYINTALHVILAVFLAWDIIKRIRDVKAANKVLFLCALNPLFYFGMLWVYTNSYSFPLIVGVFYLLTRALLESRELRRWIFLALGSAVSFYGFKLRATSIFPVVAFVVIIGVRSICRHKIKKIAVSVATFAVIFLGLNFAFNNAVSRHFSDEIMGRSFSAIHWLCIGSTGNGLVDTAGEFTAEELALGDTAAMTDYCRQLLADNYRKLGVVGTLKLWGRKYATTWSAGYTDMHLRTRLGETDSELYTYFTGDRNFAFRLYCNLYRVLIFAGMLLFSVRKLKNRELLHGADDEYDYTTFYDVMTLTVFGGMLFYVLWEAKTSYSNPFLIFMIILATDGMAKTVPSGIKPCHRIVKFAPALAMVLVIATNVCVYASLDSHVVSRVNGMDGNELVEVNVCMAEQTFYADEPFNRITIVLNDEAQADFQLVLSAEETLLYTCVVPSDSVTDGRAVIDIPFAISSENKGLTEYRIELSTCSGESGLVLYQSRSSYFATYQGQLYLDGVLQKDNILLGVEMVG